MGTGAAELRKFFVHKAHKSKLASGGSIRKSHCAIVCGFHHCVIEKVFNFAGFTFGKSKVGAGFVIACSFFGKSIFGLWVKALKRHCAGEDFCYGSGFAFCVFVSADKNLSGFCVHYAPGFGNYFRRRHCAERRNGKGNYRN